MKNEMYVTVQQAADLTGATREKIGRLIKDGTLPVQPSKLDARRKLIPLKLVERLLEEEGHGPALRTRMEPYQQVWDELGYISANSPGQEMFRMAYFHFRLCDLMKDPKVSPRVAIKQAQRLVHVSRPGFRPKYDKRLLSGLPLDSGGSDDTPSRD